MKMIYLILTGFVLLVNFGCASSATDQRVPAGTGDIDSSTNLSAEHFESYKLPITRGDKKTTRMAYNFWSGEWPFPVIDVNSTEKGQTKIVGYMSLRNPTDADKVSCTIENGIYHPWSEKDPSLLTYYTVTQSNDFKVVKDTTYELYNEKKKKLVKVKVPKRASFNNVVYYAENECGSIYKVGKTSRPFSSDCGFFFENPALVKASDETEFKEQWLYLTCEEKNADGKPIKVFVQDTNLLSQPGIEHGCPGEYGQVKDAKSCPKE